jgi:hypothetical protein
MFGTEQVYIHCCSLSELHYVIITQRYQINEQPIYIPQNFNLHQQCCKNLKLHHLSCWKYGKFETQEKNRNIIHNKITNRFKSIGLWWLCMTHWHYLLDSVHNLIFKAACFINGLCFHPHSKKHLLAHLARSKGPAELVLICLTIEAELASETLCLFKIYTMDKVHKTRIVSVSTNRLFWKQWPVGS